MVDVQVRVHDQVHLRRAHACTRELGEKPRARIRHKRARLRPEAGVDEHCRAGAANQDDVDREPPLLAAAQRRERVPNSCKAAIAVDEDGDVERADSHSGSGFRPPNPSSTRCQ